MSKKFSAKQKQVKINSFNDLYDFVKQNKENNYFVEDIEDLINSLIFRWFSCKRVNGLDTCYRLFSEKIKENDGFIVRIENDKIKAEWE